MIEPACRWRLACCCSAGSWYIVTCPRAARPFDAEEQAEEYPGQYYVDMLALADDLQRAAGRHCLHGEALRLRIGVHCGPVAGAVVGVMRAFYCLYGDAVRDRLPLTYPCLSARFGRGCD